MVVLRTALATWLSVYFGLGLCGRVLLRSVGVAVIVVLCGGWCSAVGILVCVVGVGDGARSGGTLGSWVGCAGGGYMACFGGGA